MASVTIEDSIYEEFVKMFPDNLMQKQIASKQIAKLLEPATRKKQYKCTSIVLNNEQKAYIEGVMAATRVTRKDYLSELIMNCSKEDVDQYFGPASTFKRNPAKNVANKIVSFTPENKVYEKWKMLSDHVYVSMQMIIDYVLMLQMKRDKFP
tara:strand:- start:235 stop:690 length:456 start_codon:yes stop_codon:yes gene_type:complete